jgi:hypothetical protein
VQQRTCQNDVAVDHGFGKFPGKLVCDRYRDTSYAAQVYRLAAALQSEDARRRLSRNGFDARKIRFRQRIGPGLDRGAVPHY